MSFGIYEDTLPTVNKDDVAFRYLAVEDGKVAFAGDELPAELANEPIQSVASAVARGLVSKARV